MDKQPLTILLANPRGFCAGVERAIEIVEQAILKFGAPVYVRHEIVHNRYVVEELEAKGAIFVEELDEVPDTAPVVFSAHGVPKSVPAEAQHRRLFYLDATCPLVSKVHHEAEHHFAAGRRVILIGHAGHPEVVGTMGQLPPGAIMLVETVHDAERVAVVPPDRVAYVTQTTLAVEETEAIVAILRRRFPAIHGPRSEDICYATSNRQQAVKEIAPRADVLVILGAPNSSNSMRLVEVARRSGCAHALLLERAADMDWGLLSPGCRLGVSAGASAPEVLVSEVLDAFRARFDVRLEEVRVAEEHVEFKLPRELRAAD